MQETKIVCSLTCLLLTGCASSQGFDRAAMTEAFHVDPLSISASGPLGNSDTRLSLPLRLGIFFANHDFPNRQSIRKVEWLSADRERLLRQLVPLQDEQIIGDTLMLMDATLRAEDIGGIRQAGARYGADVVMIVEAAASIDRYNNRYAWLYPTLLGAYLAPGTESHALIVITGNLWAVRSEWHAPIQVAEGESKVVGSAVLVEDSPALREAKNRAIHALGVRIVDQLRLLAGELPRATPTSR